LNRQARCSRRPASERWPGDKPFGDQRPRAAPTAACLAADDDEVGFAGVGVKLDDFCGIARLFDCVRMHAGVLRPLTQIRHPLQPLGSPERKRLIHGHGVQQVELGAG
jgi:hypothetical protein